MFGTNYEDYEGILSSFVHGTYTEHATKDWIMDIHFLLIPLYSFINRVFQNVQIYGIVMVVYNWLSLTFIGLILYRILKVNFKKYNVLLFILIYTLISVDSIVNLSLNRIVVHTTVAVLLFIESRKLERKSIQMLEWTLLILAIILVSLIKAEVAALCCVVFIGVSMFFRRFNRQNLLPLGISVLIAMSYILYMANYAPEAKQTFYYKEFDFIDRNNIEYERLSNAQKQEVKLFREYLVTDKQHFTLDFYDQISQKKKSILENLFTGTSPKNYVNTLKMATPNFLVAYRFIILYFLASLLLLFTIKEERLKWLLILVILALFPLAVCFYLAAPISFLIPYYLLVGSFAILIAIQKGAKFNFILVVLVISTLLVLNKEYFDAKKYNLKQKAFSANLEKIKQSSDGGELLVINTTMYNNYMPIKPLMKLERQKVLFLNFYFLQSNYCFQDAWYKKCNCDPLSLYEKIKYLIDSKSRFVVENETFQVMKKYLSKKYNFQIQKEDIAVFDDNLNVCLISNTN